MKTAFKEWAVVVDALERGEQILILRKGGLHEGRGGFAVAASEFLLFPTLYHQQHELVMEPAASRFGDLKAAWPGEDRIRFSSWARVESAWNVVTLEQARSLRGLHGWKDEVVEQRFDWGKTRSLHVIAVRVFCLAEAQTLRMLESYGGCKSWVEIEQSISTLGSRPAVGEDTFRATLGEVVSLLGPSEWESAGGDSGVVKGGPM